MMGHKRDNDTQFLTFGGHLEVLRLVLFRILLVVTGLSIFFFSFKAETFRLLLAPSRWDFITYRVLESCIRAFGFGNFRFEPYEVRLVSTELTSQFMLPLSSSFYLALLTASPYILWELFRFVSPALYVAERRVATGLALAMYVLFTCGVLLSYYVVFPLSFRFLGTYQVDISVENTITLASYIGTFSTLTLMLGLVFQLPVVVFGLGKLGLITSSFLKRYRRHAFIVVLTLAAIITPSVDAFTLMLVTLPIYGLYVLCIIVVRWIERRGVS